MSNESSRDGCCEPQRLASESPNSEWGVDQLGDYARAENAVIDAHERHLTSAYWRLGHALSLARKQFDHGHWEKYLQSLGIEKTRAFRAMKIFGEYPTPQDVASLTVEQACRAHTVRKHTVKNELAPLKAFLKHVCTGAGKYVDLAAFADPAAAAELLLATGEAIRRLQRLEAYFRQQMGEK